MTHSLRRGALQTLEELGLPLTELLETGGWNSTRLNEYRDRKAAASRKIAQLTLLAFDDESEGEPEKPVPKPKKAAAAKKKTKATPNEKKKSQKKDNKKGGPSKAKKS